MAGLGVRGAGGRGAGGPVPARAQAQAAPATYQSPYSIDYSYPLGGLIGDLIGTDRGNPTKEASIPFNRWYAPQTAKLFKTWGPTAQQYPHLTRFDQPSWSVEAKRQRLAAMFIGHAYQHHHVPDWNPPATFPWSPTKIGHNGPGIDRSNFSSFTANVGFGVSYQTNVLAQSQMATVPKNGPGGSMPLRVIPPPPAYEDRIRTLRTGDLPNVRKDSGQIGHVTTRVGHIGRSPDRVPLVLDSHDQDILDSNGQLIPHGVQLRPFHTDNWYNRNADHALRLFSSGDGAD